MREKKNHPIVTSQNWNTRTIKHWNGVKDDNALAENINSIPNGSSPSMQEEVNVGRKDGLSKKRRQLWLEREKKKEWSQNSQPMHDDKSPGPLAIHLVSCNRKWVCAVSAICDEWHRGTHVDGKAMQPTTSATNRLQPQHTTYTPLVMHATSHTSIHTHIMVHTHMFGWWWRDWVTT